MSPEALAVLSDAIKILGPASIAAFVGYKVALAQMNIKLKEVEKNQEFAVREYMFGYYKETLLKLSESQKELNKSLGEVLSFAIGVNAEDKKDEKWFRLTTELINSSSRTGLKSLERTKRQMKKEELENEPEYEEIDQYIETIKGLEPNTDLTIIQKNVFILLDIYSHLYICHQLLLDKVGDRIFEKYLDQKV